MRKKDTEMSARMVAKRLEINYWTVLEWTKKGIFTTARRTITNRIRIKRSEVEKMAIDF